MLSCPKSNEFSVNKHKSNFNYFYLIFRSKKIIYNPKDRELDVPSLTPGDSLLLHEAYQYLVKRYITDRKNRDQLPQSKSIKKIKQEEISIKENNEELPKNIQKSSRKNSHQVDDNTSDDNDDEENNESEEDESGDPGFEPQDDPDSS